MNKGLDNGVMRKVLAWTVAFGLFGFAAAAPAVAEPIRIGMSLSLTGPTAPAGKQVLAGLEIWRDDVNAKGGLLGRPVELVYYDDQGSPANAPGIYAKLLGVDKVDLLIGPYSTNVIAAALPAIMQGNRTTIGIFGLGANEQFKYPKYFSMNSQGPSPANYSKCVFDLAAEQTPRPKRVALIGADVEYSRRALDGARENAKAMGFDIVFERTYPPSTTEFSPIVRAMQAADPDFVFAATLPVDTAGIVKAAKEIQFSAQADRRRDAGAPDHSDQTEARAGHQRLYQQRVLHSGAQPAVRRHDALPGDVSEAAAALGTDPLGYTYPPYAYAAGTNPRHRGDRDPVAQRRQARRLLRAHTFDTVIGPIEFGNNGEWATPKIICVQFRESAATTSTSSRTGRIRSSSIRRNIAPAKSNIRSHGRHNDVRAPHPAPQGPAVPIDEERGLKKSRSARPTLKDIARDVGVHVSTISRALNPKSAHAISPDLTAKIKRASSRRGYRPNAAAAALRTNRFQTIGVIIPDITDPVFPPIIRGIEDALARRGYVAILANTDGDRDRQARLIEATRARGIDGFILASVLRHDEEVSRLAAATPVVTVSRTAAPALSSVVHDEDDGIRRVLNAPRFARPPATSPPSPGRRRSRPAIIAMRAMCAMARRSASATAGRW